MRDGSKDVSISMNLLFIAEMFLIDMPLIASRTSVIKKNDSPSFTISRIGFPSWVCATDTCDECITYAKSVLNFFSGMKDKIYNKAVVFLNHRFVRAMQYMGDAVANRDQS